MAATYTVKQVAEILGYSTNSIYTFLKEKRLKGVRVGKGRFRIPQSELNRLLLISKNSVDVPVSAVTPVSAGIADVVGSRPIGETIIFGFVHAGTLNIFDWFIGASAIIAGLGLFLFNASLDRVGIPATGQGIAAMRIILIGSGLGVLLTNIAGQTHTLWHKLFHALLGVTGLAIAGVFWMRGEFDGSLTYGTLAILVLLSTVIHIGGAAWFTVYLSFLASAATVVLILARGASPAAAVFSWISLPPGTAVWLVAVWGIIFTAGLWWGYLRSKTLFWLLTWVAAVWYFALAFWYGQTNYWSRSLMFLVVGMTSLFLTPWESLAAARSRRADIFTLSVFGGITGVLVVGIGALYLIQVNSVFTVQRENTYKAAYAKNTLETAIHSITDTLAAASQNTDFTAAIAAKNVKKITDTERVIYESNNNIRRVVLLDAEGQGINLYPEGTFQKKDLSLRDYFQAVRDTGKPFVSDLFETQVDNTKRLVIAVAVPVFDDNNRFIAALVGSVNLEGLSARLQKIAVYDRQEYVVVVDSGGKRIIYPDQKKIGTEAENTDLIRKGLSGQSGAGTSVTTDGVRAVVVWTPVDADGLRWSLAIKSPVAKLYALTYMTNISLFGLMLAAVIIAGIMLQSAFFWREKIRTGGSP